MKKKLQFYDVGGQTTSTIKMKKKDGKTKFTLKNGINWNVPGETRMALTKHCAFGDEDTVIIENENYIIEIDFSTLCDLKDILNHMDDFEGNNYFGKTKLLGKK